MSTEIATHPIVASGVVHIIAATLRTGLPADVVATTMERAQALRDAPGARTVLLAHSDLSVVVATWLGGRDDLEPFAASRPHMEFVMRGLAPSITGMWAAGVEAEGDAPVGDTSLMWVFAIRSAETVFEWQVRDVLASLQHLPATVVAGPTFEERDRYRAGGVACVEVSERDAFLAALADLRSSWGEMAQHVVEVAAEVIP